MSKRWTGICCLLVMLIATVPQLAFAQAVYGNIIGTVTDQSGAAVPNAKVTVTDVRKGTSDTFTTNTDGNFSATHLIPDDYKVRIEASGFKTVESQALTVNADASARFDAKLEVGQVSEQVVVTGEAPQLKTDRSDVNVTFNDRYVTELPLVNRNFQSILLDSPGTQELAGWNHASTENPQASHQIFVNGQNFSGTGYELDGTDNQDPILGIIVINPNVDAITEAKVSEQNYFDAEFGKATAGLVTVQTKSGSNDLHGSAYWYRRTDATEARDPFTQYAPNPITGRYIPKDRWNQFGFTAGGPVIKNKLFWFADYQGTRSASGQTFQLTIPTQQVIKSCTGSGDGSGYCNLSAYVPFIGNGTAGDPSTLIYDPATGNQATGTGRTPFCGPAGCATQPDWIPLNRISAVAQKMLAAFPTPTNGGLTNNFIASGSGPFAANNFDTRIDWDAASTVNVFGRFSIARFSLSGTPLLGATIGGVGNGQGGLSGSSINHDYSLSTGVTKTFSSTLLADFRFGWFRYNPNTHKPDEGKSAASDLGMTGLNMGDTFTSGLPSLFKLGPAINAGQDQSQFALGDGLNVGRCNCPLVESEQQFQFVNNWTKMRGNHQIKFGADIRYAMNLRVPSDANRTGQLTFDTGPTSNAGVGGAGFATFLLGDVLSFERFVSTSTNAAERQKRWFFYGQDSWRVTPKLTVNYGLRWEIYFPESVNGKGNGGFANPVEGIIRVAGYGPYGLNGGIANNFKNFAPRLAVAYQISPKTVLRMGYGRSFDMGVFGSNFGHAVTQNLPVLVDQKIQTANNYVPAFTLSQGPPAFSFPPIPSNGVLPLGGPAGNVQPRMRPTYERLPTLDAWNVSVQRQITANTTVDVAYVGTMGHNTFAGNGPAYDLNPAALGPGTAIVTAAGVEPNFTANTPYDQRRPYYNKFNINGILCCTFQMGSYFGNDASSNYNALQVKVNRNFTSGFQFQANYTYSRAYNHSTDSGGLYAITPNNNDVYGPVDFNRKHVIQFNAVYQLPFGKGKMFAGNVGRAADLIIGGWQLSTIMNISSGLPWSPSIGECGMIHDNGPCIPNYSGGFNMGAGSFDPNTHKVTYFTPVAAIAYPTSALTVGADTCSLSRPSSGAFSLPACGTDGKAGRNSFWGPGHFMDDLSLAKNFGITERVKAEFRMDAVNVFNHPVLDFSAQDYSATGGTCVDCGGNNGKIQDIQFGTTMRQLTFALRLTF